MDDPSPFDLPAAMVWTMTRLPVALLFLGAVAGPAAADDWSATLANSFEQSCGRRPPLPSVLHRLAKATGFESAHGPVKPSLESGETIDVVYSARRIEGDGLFKLSAYFNGKRDDLAVECSVSANEVNADNLAAAIEAAEKASSPMREVLDDGAIVKLTWMVGADRLVMSARRDDPHFTSVNLSYKIRKP